MQHTIAIKRPNEALELTHIDGEYRCDVRKVYDKDPEDYTYLQYVTIRESGDRVLALAVDEDGLGKNLPSNFHMLLRSGNHSFYDTIVGTAVFLAYRWEDPYEKEIYDFELLDLNKEDIQAINHLLSTQTQQKYRTIAQMDPFVHKDKHMVIFEEIKDIEEHLAAPKAGLTSIPSFFVAHYLFSHWPVGKAPICFFADKMGTIKYKAGIKVASRIGRTMEFYCEEETTAKNFSMEVRIGDVGITVEQAAPLLIRYLESMQKMGLPAYLYVTEETATLLQDKKRGN